MSFNKRKNKKNKVEKGFHKNYKNAWIIGQKDLDYKKVDLGDETTFNEKVNEIVGGTYQNIAMKDYLLIVNDAGKLIPSLTTNTMATSLWHEGTEIETPFSDYKMSPYLEQELVGNAILVPYQSDFDFRIHPQSSSQFNTTWLDDDSHDTNWKLICGDDDIYLVGEVA